MNALYDVSPDTDIQRTIIQNKITKIDKDFAEKLDFKDVKFPVKVRDIQKIERKKIQSALAALVMKIRKNI